MKADDLVRGELRTKEGALFWLGVGLPCNQVSRPLKHTHTHTHTHGRPTPHPPQTKTYQSPNTQAGPYVARRCGVDDYEGPDFVFRLQHTPLPGFLGAYARVLRVVLAFWVCV